MANSLLTTSFSDTLIRFFKSGSHLLIIGVLLLLVAIRFPLFNYTLPLTVSELNWMLVGERMGRGFMLYSEIWDNISPLSAVVYWAIDTQFGRMQLAYHMSALILTAIQAIYFNALLTKNQVFPEKTYLPGMFYAILINISFDFYTLSPVLMANTFLLIAIDKLFAQVDQRSNHDKAFEVGFYIGMAVLFYLPASVFILVALFTLILFSPAGIRQLSLAIFGFAFPLSLTTLIFFLIGNYDFFLKQYLLSFFTIDRLYFMNYQSFLLLFSLPALLTLLGINKLLVSMRYINYQKRCQQIMGLWLIFGIISVLIAPSSGPRQFIFIVPCMAFFAVPYFLSVERKWIGEAVFLIFFVGTLFIHYAGIYSFLPNHELVSFNELRVKPSTLHYPVKRKKILVLGNKISEYRFNSLATPYLNWQIAQSELTDTDDYESVSTIYQNFEKDPPDVIIDWEGAAKPLFARMPALARQYESTVEKGVYVRKGVYFRNE